MSARYEQIAQDLAEKVVRGEYHEGDRLFGRSTLAGTYQVSPETIRRAIALLHARGVLRVEAGRGIQVLSAVHAARFLEEVQARDRLEELQQRFQALLQERRRIDAELEQVQSELVATTARAISARQSVAEFVLPRESPLAGLTLAGAQIRQRTGATVIALGRDGEDIYSPPPDLVLAPGDQLVVVGSAEARDLVRQWVEGIRVPVP